MSGLRNEIRSVRRSVDAARLDFALSRRRFRSAVRAKLATPQVLAAGFMTGLSMGRRRRSDTPAPRLDESVRWLRRIFLLGALMARQDSDLL